VVTSLSNRLLPPSRYRCSAACYTSVLLAMVRLIAELGWANFGAQLCMPLPFRAMRNATALGAYRQSSQYTNLACRTRIAKANALASFSRLNNTQFKAG